jgi:hypothetical protein
LQKGDEASDRVRIHHAARAGEYAAGSGLACRR